MTKKLNTAFGASAESQLTIEEMQRAIQKIKKRLFELDGLNPDTLKERGDIGFKKVEIKTNQTLIEIFGEKSPKYHNFSCRLDTAPYSMAGPVARDRWLEGYKRGLEKSKSNLNTLIEILKEQIAEAPDDLVARAKSNFTSMDLHPEIVRASAQLFGDGHYANAIENACKVLDNLVKLRSGVDDKSGTSLMQSVFGSNPKLVFSNHSNDSERSEQRGMMHLYTGTMLAFRNPRAHQIIKDNHEETLEIIGFISFLCKSLERAKKP